MDGTLYVVATPIGNLEDLSARAIRILHEVDCIACEDTRLTARLLARHGIETPRVSCHKFNERARLASLLAKLEAGRDVALVSDGGTPGISDPGAVLVRAALEAGVAVVPIPGPCAAATLLSVSGLDADRFRFEGFLPHRAGDRRRRLRELAVVDETIVFHEAPHRILATLEDLAAIVGDRPLVLGRELTKRHETLLRGSAEQLAGALGPGEVRGELTLAIGPAPSGAGASRDADDAARVRTVWRAALCRSDGDARRALRAAARELGLKRPELRRLLDELGVD